METMMNIKKAWAFLAVMVLLVLTGTAVLATETYLL
jgi:hypothetical protein